MAMKAISVLCLLLCAQVFAVRNLEATVSRSLKQEETGATAIVSGDIFLSGPGTVNVFANARAEAETNIANAFLIAFVNAVADVEGGGDALAIAAVQGGAFASAVAEALAQTVINIQSTAPGAVACFFAEADAEATASAFAAIFVRVLAQASNDISFAQSSATIAAIVDVTVSAYAKAISEACVLGEFSATTYIRILATAIGQPFIDICALAFALVNEGVAVAQILVELNADVLEVSTVDGRTATDVIGEASAGSGGSGGTDITGR